MGGEAALFFTIASTAFQAVSAISQGKAASRAAQFNAQMAERDAQITRNKAFFDERASRIQSKKEAGRARNILASAGQEGTTAQNLLAEQVVTGELDALLIRLSGELSAGNLESQAQLDRLRGKAAKRRGFFQAGSTLLSGGARFGEQGGFEAFKGGP